MGVSTENDSVWREEGAERRVDVLAGEVRDDDAMTTRGARGKATRARRTGDD